MLYADASGLGINCSPTSDFKTYQEWQYCQGAITIPRADNSTGRLLWNDDWYGETHNAQIWANPAERRQMAASLAKIWADKSPKDVKLPWRDTDVTQVDLVQCNDCMMFVSYILWRVGFRMTDVDLSNGEPVFPAYEVGWWAAGVTSEGLSGSSASFQTVHTFVGSWIKPQNGEASPRADHPTDDLNIVQIGDVILYDYPGGDDWDHAAIVVQKGATLMVASRGGSQVNGNDPNKRDCTAGWRRIIYNSSGETGGRVPSRIWGLHIHYE